MHRAFGIIPGQVTGYSTKASLCGKKYTEFQTRKKKFDMISVFLFKFTEAFFVAQHVIYPG